VHTGWLAGLVALGLGFAGTAQAQEERSEAEARAEALELHAQSRERYERGDYEASVALLQRAYEVFPEPNVLYNLARAHGQMGAYAEAIEAYERFLSEVPDTPLRAVIEERVVNLRALLAEQEAAAARREAERRELVARARREAQREAQRGPDVAPWILFGSGLGVVAVGAVFGGLSIAARDQAEADPTFVGARAASHDAVTFGWVANGAFLVGGVTALVAAVWGVADVVAVEGGGSEDASALRLDARGIGAAF